MAQVEQPDQLARIIADKLGQELKQNIIIENIAGGGTIIGTDKVAKSIGDGYTLLLCSSTSFVNNPVFKGNLPYKVESDFTGIGLLTNSPMVLVQLAVFTLPNNPRIDSFSKGSPW
jgi:tripartite-type tricarboxylate transporter receptor subunit TctC